MGRARNSNRGLSLDQARGDALLLLKQKAVSTEDLLGRASFVVLTTAILIASHAANRQKPDQVLSSLLYSEGDNEIATLIEGCPTGKERQFCRNALSHLAALPEQERTRILRTALSTLSYASRLSVA